MCVREPLLAPTASSLCERVSDVGGVRRERERENGRLRAGFPLSLAAAAASLFLVLLNQSVNEGAQAALCVRTRLVTRWCW